MLILLLVLIIIEVVDVSINKIYLFIRSMEFPLVSNILTFISVAFICIIGQHLILRYVKRSSKEIITSDKLRIPIIYLLVRLSQYTMMAIMIVVILQMITTSHYNNRLLVSLIWISYGVAIFMLGLLARRFFHWFVSNRNNVVLFYGLATASIAVDAGISLVLTTFLLIFQPIDTQQIVGSESPAIPDSIMPLNYAFNVVSVISFGFTWFATALVLRSHSRRLGTIKYWIIISIPFVYFLTQFQPLFSYLVSSYNMLGPVTFAIIYTVIFSASKPAGGLLFAAAFWSIAKTINSKQVRDYMIISAYGLALIFGSEQAIILANRPYPPFGLPTVSFLGLASFLVLVGVYSSAISVSEDSKLRRSIREFAIRESKLLDSIGTAQMEQEIQNRVIEFTRGNQDMMAEETGIQPSLTDEDVKAYLEQVIKEVKKVGSQH
jgi:hypothetical protein